MSLHNALQIEADLCASPHTTIHYHLTTQQSAAGVSILALACRHKQ
jgi:hypothetical protein